MITPPRGKSERAHFSLGERPVPGEKPSPDAQKDAEKRGTCLSKSLDDNAKTLKEIFHVPETSDVVFREVNCAKPRIRALVGYVEGMSAFDKLFRCVLQPLMLLSSLRTPDEKNPVAYLEAALLPNGQVERKETIEAIVESMAMGDALVLVDGSSTALIVETKGWEHRSVGEAVSERIVRGPQQGFVEVLRSNTGLVRSIIQTPDLIVESLDIGVRAKTKCALLYVKNLACPKIVEEARRRILGIDASEVLTSGQLEQYIEATHSMVPTILSTERPDRVAHFLMQGMIAIIVAGDPFALVAPVTFFTFTHSPEDNYIRWPFGNVLRLIRYVSLFLTVFLPGIYVAVVNYHPEMIPTTLMMAIAASREPIPFPLFVEVLVMYFGFELIREAGIRIPSPMGPTIGIVGALLIGEAAVTASIVSPILVIVIAVTAVASFTIPNLELAMFTRVATLVFILAGATFGLLGIVALTYVLLSQAFVHVSFGVPFLTPQAPARETTGYGSFVTPPWTMGTRPTYLHPQDARRQGSESRLWDAGKTLYGALPNGKKGEDGGKPEEQVKSRGTAGQTAKTKGKGKSRD